MKLVLAAVLAVAAATACAEEPNPQYTKVPFASDQLISEVYVDESKVILDVIPSGPVRIGVSRLKMQPGAKMPNGKKVETVTRLTVHDCHVHAIGVVIQISYDGEKVVDLYAGGDEDVFDANANPLFSAEHKAICSVPKDKLIPAPTSHKPSGKYST